MAPLAAVAAGSLVMKVTCDGCDASEDRSLPINWESRSLLNTLCSSAPRRCAEDCCDSGGCNAGRCTEAADTDTLDAARLLPASWTAQALVDRELLRKRLCPPQVSVSPKTFLLLLQTLPHFPQ
jgi:hypothetical protein